MTRSTRAWLEITRISNLPTVLSGVLVMSYANMFLFNGRDHPWGVVGLLVAISCFYVGGFIFNDVFDRHIDQDERPARPIPSGRIPVHLAVQVGILLLVAGLMIIATLDELFTVQTSERGEPNGLVDAVILIILILLYNRFHAASPWMVFVMAACRVLVYTTVALTLIESRADLIDFFDAHLSSGSWWFPLVVPWPYYLLALFFYVASFSYLARPEARPAKSDTHYCYRCGFTIADSSTARCSECGQTFDPKRLARSTAPPPNWLHKLCLAGTLLPWALLLVSRVILDVVNRAAMSAVQPGPATTALTAFWTVVSIAIFVLVGTWFFAAIRRYLRYPGQPGPAILMWLAGIPLLDGLLAFYLGAPWIALICLALFLVTIWGHRRVTGT